MYLIRRNNIYYLRYFDEDKGRERSISTRQTSKKLAHQFLSKFKKQLEDKSKLKPIILSKFAEDYKSYIKLSFSSSYFRSVNYSFKYFIAAIGDLPLIKITSYIAEQFLLNTFKRSKHAAYTHYKDLKAAFNKAKVWGYLADNVFTKIKLPRLEKRFPLFLTVEEHKRICGNEDKLTMRAVFVFAFYTGTRVGEIINLQWKDIDFNMKIIRISNSKTFVTKSRADRIVPMCKIIYELLKERFPKMITVGKPNYVFAKKSGYKFSSSYVSHRFKLACRKSKLDERYRFHDLRHSFASELVQRGISIYVLKELLGHSDISTTQIYAHLQNHNLMEAIKVFDNEQTKLEAV